MARGKTLTVAFKQNHQHQLMVFPPNLDDMIAANHPIRTINEILDKVDISKLIEQYKPGGTSSYHPRMLLKVVVYAYVNNVYSSRKIEEMLQQNIFYMWLSGMSKPDHNTINRFRGKRLEKTLQPIFTQVVLLLCEEGLLNVKDLYTDGTRIEANANRYSFVWGKGIKTNKEKITQQLNELWRYAQQVAAAEMDDTDPTGFDKIDKEKVEQTIAGINDMLKDKPVPVKVKQQLKRAAKKWPEMLERYEQQERVIGEGRNSYSKTDPDATFMRMKEDHLGNGQLKPAYNLQISTNNQYIAAYSIYQTPADTSTLISHVSQIKEEYGKAPGSVTTDAGYGSEQNYQWLEDEQVEAYVKYNHFDAEQQLQGDQKRPFSSDHLYYNKEKDRYYCPMGQPMLNIGTIEKPSTNGYPQLLTRYQARNCDRCPLRGVCHKGQGDRIMEVNHNLNRLKQQAKEVLTTPEGIEHRKRRGCEVETVFGNIKHNHSFRRFMLRGKEKVTIETGLLALAHNLRKKTA